MTRAINNQRHWIYWVLVVLVTLSVLVISIISPGIDGYNRARLGDMVFGTAHKPFVYRTLLPSTARLIQAFIPGGVRSFLGEKLLAIPAVQIVFETLEWDEQYLLDYIIVILLLFISLLGFYAAMKYLFASVFVYENSFGDWAALAAVACLPLLFKYYTYIYDFPDLFLFSLALGLMVRQKWDLFLVVYVFSCFNKETTILLTMVFIIHYFNGRKINRGLFMKLAAIQVVLFGIIKAILYFLYINNPGDFVEFHLMDYNLRYLRKIKLIPFLLIWGPIVFLTFFKWQKKPRFLRDALWIIVPLMVLTLLLGFLDELRDYYEAYPVIFLLIATSIGMIFGQEFRHSPHERGVGSSLNKE